MLLLISRSIITMSKLHKKVAVSAIFRKNCNLQNLAFYNFCQNLGFGQFCSSLLYHGTITTTKLLRKHGIRAIFRKTCHLRNFAFYNFSDNLYFQSYEEGWAILQLPLISRSIITMSKVHKKSLQKGISSNKFVIYEIFTTFARVLFSTITRGLSNFAAVYYNIVSLLRQSFSESLESELSSEKLVICEILRFTNFNGNLVYFLCINFTGYCISSNKRPRRLLNFEAVMYMYDAYQRAALVSNLGNRTILNIKILFFFKMRMKHTFSLPINQIL